MPPPRTLNVRAAAAAIIAAGVAGMLATADGNCGYDTVTALPGQNLRWSPLRAGFPANTATDCLEACCDDTTCGGYTWTSYQPPLPLSLLHAPHRPLPRAPQKANPCPTGAKCCWLKKWGNNPNDKAPQANCTSGIVKHEHPAPGPGPAPGPTPPSPSPSPNDRPAGVPAKPDCAMRELAASTSASVLQCPQALYGRFTRRL